MIKIITVIGARPQIIKAAALSRAIQEHFADDIREVIVHTGQHYDDNMSEVFFRELGIPRPDHNLEVGSGSHGRQTAAMIKGLEEILEQEQANAIVVYGDTNSTLAAAIAASKLHVAVVHIEAGLRSFNKSMPEEVNRIMCDHVSTLLFSPTKSGVVNLQKEGFNLFNEAPFTIDNPKVYHCGDVMYDNSLHFAKLAASASKVLEKNDLEAGKYVLATVHRPANTDDPEKLTNIFRALQDISANNGAEIVLPLHPRTAKLMEKNLAQEVFAAVQQNERFHLLPPASFLDMTALEKNAAIVMTDSGGVQKEAFFFEKPCVILRPETEWVELVENGNALLADASYDKIMAAYTTLTDGRTFSFPSYFGDGEAGKFIAGELLRHLE